MDILVNFTHYGNILFIYFYFISLKVNLYTKNLFCVREIFRNMKRIQRTFTQKNNSVSAPHLPIA